MKLFALGFLTLASTLLAQGDSDKFDATLALIKVSPGEARWDEIAWTTSLWEARKRAAAEGKPLFIWAANGHPMGVT